jgi:hypothetical protein
MYQITIFHRITAVILIMSVLQSCRFYNFKQISDSKEAQKGAIYKMPSGRFFYIVHVGEEAWQLSDVKVSGDEVKGKLTTMNNLVEQYMHSAYEGGSKRVGKNHHRYVNQVHFHVSELSQVGEEVTINMDNLVELNVMKYNAAASTLVTTGIVLGSIVGGFTIFLLIVCSCPHTYIYDGNEYYFNNTLFTGATSEKLERDDYKKMPDYDPSSGSYSFYVKNEDQEVQHINLLELIVVNHDKKTEVAMDENGGIHALKNQKAPTKVTDNSGHDLTSVLSYRDDESHSFDNESEENYNYVYATFDVPNSRDNAKLVLSAKNNPWGGFVYHEFSKKFGKYYDNWVKRNGKKSKEEVYASLKKAGIPLVVSVKKNGEWIDVEELELVGDISHNTLAIPIDSDLLKGDQVEVRVRSGFMFWDLDHLNMDFTPETELNVQRLKPTSVEGSTTQNGVAALNGNDNKYVSHFEMGDSTSIQFTGIKNQENMTRTIYLRSKGYYKPEKRFDGPMQRKELEALNIDGGLSILSRELYNEAFQTVSLKD